MTEYRVWDEIEIPKELDKVIKDAVEEGHRRLQRKRKGKYLRVAAISMATAAACFIAVAVGFTNPVVARAYSNIPVIGNIFAYLYDTADSGIPYAQVGEAAVPVNEQDETAQRLGQEEPGREGLGQMDSGQEGSGQEEPGREGLGQMDSGQKGSGQEESGQENLGQKEPGQEGSGQEGEADTADSVQIAIREYFCDGYSLYLSFEVSSEEPFMEDVTDMAGKEGSVFLYATETMATETGERAEIGKNGSMVIRGMFTDERTFVGIARSGGSLGEYPVKDGMVYEMDSAHMRVFAGEQEADIRGEWKVSTEITCSEESLMTESLGQTIRGDCVLKEVRIQPYEIQVVIEELKGRSLADEFVLIEVFDDQGRRLSAASQSINRFVDEGDKRQEIWMFEKPTDAKKVTVFAVDEIKWLDEWKGYLYSDNPWSGEQMARFLKENCFTYGEVELP